MLAVEGPAHQVGSAVFAAAVVTLTDSLRIDVVPSTSPDPDAADRAEARDAERRREAMLGVAEAGLADARAKHGLEVRLAEQLYSKHHRHIADGRRWRLRLDLALACLVRHAQEEHKRTMRLSGQQWRPAFRLRQEGVLLERFAERVFQQPATSQGKLTHHMHTCLSAAAHLEAVDHSLLVLLLQKGLNAPLCATIESIDAWARGESEPEQVCRARCAQLRLLVGQEEAVLASAVQLATRVLAPEDGAAPTLRASLTEPASGEKEALAPRPRRRRRKLPTLAPPPEAGKRRRARALSDNEKAVRARAGAIVRDWPTLGSAGEVRLLLAACLRALLV